MEAAGLGIFMLSAVVFATLLEHPSSPFRAAIGDPLFRRIPMGLAMGLTAMGIMYSPWGQRSGAHINPAVTLTFYRLGKIARWDAVFYVVAQFVGGLAGVVLPAVLIGRYMAAPSVNYLATVPGEQGVAITFVAECTIAFILMAVVLIAMNDDRLAPLTGGFAGLLVAIYVIVEAPFSGFGMNPARTLASALPAWLWTSFLVCAGQGAWRGSLREAVPPQYHALHFSLRVCGTGLKRDYAGRSDEVLLWRMIIIMTSHYWYRGRRRNARLSYGPLWQTHSASGARRISASRKR